RRRAGQELRLHVADDRAGKIRKRHLDEWHALDVVDPDGIERNIDAPGLLDDFAQVLLDGKLVERVDERCLGHSSGLDNLARHRLDGGSTATGQEYPGPFAGERAGHRTDDGSSRSVDDRVLLLKSHVLFILL